MTSIEEERVAKTANVLTSNPFLTIECGGSKKSCNIRKEGGLPKKLFLGLISIVNWPYLGGQKGGVK